METPAEVLIYFDQLAGEPKRARLLTVSPLGYYEVNMQMASGLRRALLPIERTFVVAVDVEESTPVVGEVER